jgi:hypothetical protein
MTATNASTGVLGFLRTGRSLFFLLGLMFVLPLRAQTVTAPSEAQLDHDVQLLLGNDDDFVALKQQLAAKQITNVEYTRQSQTLTAARNEIVKGYDRPGYQRLLALYNAAKRDKQLAAAAAARQAATEARAKAAAEKEAARQAAIQAAEEKAAAAKALAEAQAKELEADVQASVKNHLRVAELTFRQQMAVITPAEQQEMQGLGSIAAEISKKYADGAPGQAQAKVFQQKVAQQYQSQLPIAGKQWLIEAFPAADRVTEDFPEGVRRDAALNYLANLLALKVGNPLPEAADQRIRQYGGAAGRGNFEKSSKLAKDGEFQLEVLKKYLPFYIPEVQVQMAVAKQLGIQQETEAKLVARGKRIGALLSLLLVGLVGFGVFLAFRVKTVRQEPSVSGDPLQLPDALSVVKVFRKEYPVKFEAGIVYEKEVWTETNVSTTTTGGGSYVAGNTVYSSPVQTTTHVSTTVYHRYWIRTPDGRETWYRFSDNVFPAAKGHIISAISAGTDVQLAYNHTTGSFGVLDPGIRKSHFLKARWCILIPMGIWLVGSFAITSAFSADYIGPRRNSDFVWAGAIGLGIILSIIMVALKIAFVLIRNSQYRSRYMPKFRQFMESCTPELAKRLPTLMAQPVQQA